MESYSGQTSHVYIRRAFCLKLKKLFRSVGSRQCDIALGDLSRKMNTPSGFTSTSEREGLRSTRVFYPGNAAS